MNQPQLLDPAQLFSRLRGVVTAGYQISLVLMGLCTHKLRDCVGCCVCMTAAPRVKLSYLCASTSSTSHE